MLRIDAEYLGQTHRRKLTGAPRVVAYTGDDWDDRTYDVSTAAKIATGTTFGYTRSAKRTGRMVVHDNLNIVDEDGNARTRESRDFNEERQSTPIVIGFDVTGSMQENPAILQRELKGLFGMLNRKDVVDFPQVAIAAYGDTHCDSAPVQFSQFESGNLIDENLDNVLIEGGGGGNDGETSTAIAWYVGNHVETDAWDKRGKKGYLFLIGDECAFTITSRQAKKFLGENVQSGITPKMAFDAAKERWHVFFLLIDNYSAKYQHSRDKYERLIGKDNVITLQDASAAPAVIASVIGVVEDTVSHDELSAKLMGAGFSEEAARIATSATRGLARISQSEISKADDSYADLGL